jgi:type IV secretory pathway VirD2 relaxase
MAEQDEFQVRPGRIRSSRAQRARPFITQVLTSVEKAGGHVRRNGSLGSQGRSHFGRGQVAFIQANRFISSRSRGVMIKARFVRHASFRNKLGPHLAYLKREGVTHDGDKARLFGPGTDDADPKAFAERCENDRHHFRFIVSPDDALEMADLNTFARDLMGQMEKDLGTQLDWVGVTHWNTEHPHIHIILRGRTDDGQDLVINRDYIKQGMRDRAAALITQELGPRTDLDIRRTLEKQITSERWTSLDRQLWRDASRTGFIDLAPKAGQPPDEFQAPKIGRIHKLESLSLAEQVAPGQWAISEKAETTLRELGERGDIIKRIHNGLRERGIERSAANYVLAGESLDVPVIGRLLDRGLDDELKGTAYAVIDGVDGRTHHIKLGDIDSAGDGALGSIVELRIFDDVKGRRRVALAVRSDLSVESQITARGATWLDRQAVAKEPIALGQSGFGSEVRDALERRADHLVHQGLANRRAGGIVFSPNLLNTLRKRELQTLGERLAADIGRSFHSSSSGEYVAGTYQRRFALASGRFAMIDDGLGFQLVPWSPSLEKHLGQHVSGVARGDGGIDWSFGRKRGLGL